MDSQPSPQRAAEPDQVDEEIARAEQKEAAGGEEGVGFATLPIALGDSDDDLVEVLTPVGELSVSYWNKFGRPPRNPTWNFPYLSADTWCVDPLKQAALSELKSAPDLPGLEQARTAYLGATGVVLFSPEGERLAFLARDPAGHWQVWVTSTIPESGGEPRAVTDHRDVAPILARSCAACHTDKDGNQPAGNLVLDPSAPDVERDVLDEWILR